MRSVRLSPPADADRIYRTTVSGRRTCGSGPCRPSLTRPSAASWRRPIGVRRRPTLRTGSPRLEHQCVDAVSSEEREMNSMDAQSAFDTEAALDWCASGEGCLSAALVRRARRIVAPHDVTAAHKEVAAASLLAPDRWTERHCTIRMNVTDPARPYVAQEIEVDRCLAAAGTQHGCRPSMSVFSSHVDPAGANMLGDVHDAFAAKSAFAPRE